MSITDNGESVSHNIQAVLTVSQLKSAMIQKKVLLNSSVTSVQRLDPIGNLHLYICKFDSKGCSSASPNDFDGTIVLLRQLEFQRDKTKVDPFIRNVGWRFFSLREKIPVYEDGHLKDFTLPFVHSESSRMEELKKGITTSYKDLQPVPFPQGQGYCQFSGGGDICFVSNGKEATVITTVEDMIMIQIEVDSENCAKTTRKLFYWLLDKLFYKHFVKHFANLVYCS